MFTTGSEAAQPAAAPTAAPAHEAGHGDDDEMARAIAKLEAEQTFGTNPAAREAKQVAAVHGSPLAPAPGPGGYSEEEEEMAAAIAKLEKEQTFGTKPAPAQTKPAPLVQAAPELKTSAKVEAIPEEDIPEIDDDLVVPDDDDSSVEGELGESATRSKRNADPNDEDDEETHHRKKKGRADEDDEEDEIDRSKKRRLEDEEGVDAGRSQKTKRGYDEEDDEDEGAFTEKPQSKKSQSRIEEDDNDEPQSRTRGRDVDDEEDDGPRRIAKKKKRTKAGSPMMLILLIGGGILGLFGCCTCGIGGYFMLLSNPVVGKWETDFLLVKLEFEFYRGGTGKMTMSARGEEGTVFFDYKLTGSDPMIMELKATRFEGKANKDEAMFGRRSRLRVQIDGDTMTLTDADHQGPINIPLKLRRVR
jgi:hypothetical protein